jgi:S1-C subfamily serine protease
MNRALVAGLALVGLTLAAPPVPAQAPPPPGERAARAFLGIMAEATPREGTEEGVLVRGVTPDSPAAKAGLKPGDIIVKVGDKAVKGPEGLVAALASHKPGDKVSFRVTRSNKEQTFDVTLGQRPVRRLPGPGEPPRERAGGFLGVRPERLTADEQKRLGVTTDHGVAVADVLPGSHAAKAGLKAGDVITEAAGHKINDPAELRNALLDAGVGKEITLKVLRGKESKEVKARLEEPPIDGLSFPRIPRPVPPGGGLGRPGGLPSAFGPEGAQELERRVAELERRVRELEQKRGPTEK